jgi:hypothetical protein
MSDLKLSLVLDTGHANPATTRRYTLVSLDRMRAAVDAAARYGTPLHAVS